MGFKTELLTRAQALGFNVCRIACAAPPAHAREFEQWLSEGRAGEMTWLERNKERRVDPQKVLPCARSVIVLGMNYFQGEPNDQRMQKQSGAEALRHSSFPANPGRIARY